MKKFLSLENPVITEKMINFLTSMEVCTHLISFITRIQTDTGTATEAWGEKTPTTNPATLCTDRSREDSPELRYSFRVMSILTEVTPNSILHGLIAERAGLICSSLFEVFLPNSAGSYYHACAVMRVLITYHLDAVYETVGKNQKSVRKYIGSMLNYMSQPPVGEIVADLICCPVQQTQLSQKPVVLPAHRPTQPFAHKWRMYRSLAEWRVVLVLASHVYTRGYPDAHVSAAAEVFLVLIRRLSTDDNGEMLLQPLCHCQELVEGLAAAVINEGGTHSEAQQYESLRMLHEVVALSQVTCCFT